MRNAGVDNEIGDFSSGYTSIIDLTKVLPARLKVDQRLIQPIVSDPKLKELAQSIVKIGTTLGISVIDDGVETQKHATLLSEIGYHVLQGCALSRPLSWLDLFRFLTELEAK